MKLSINKMYVIYTTSNFIENKQVKILGYIGYDRASQYQSLIQYIAINEQFIDNTGNSQEYLQNQIYYDCVVVENVNGEWINTNEHIVLWDDIIDMSRTQRLNENYNYKLSINFKNLGPSDSFTKETIVNEIKSFIESKYNTTSEKVGISLTEIYDNSMESTTTKLQETEELLEKTSQALTSIVSLENSAKEIVNAFTLNDINTKVNNISSKLGEIEINVDRVISQFK